MNNGHVTMVLLLDLSTVFKTIDHDILLHRLPSVLGINRSVLSWVSSYLTDRTQRICVSDLLSFEFALPRDVPLFTTPSSYHLL